MPDSTNTVPASDGVTPEVSIVIPARNEEAEIANCLIAAWRALKECHVTGEVIVVDDGSEDATASIARSGDAEVVSVELHNIGAVRNAGADVAKGETLVFVDADTHLPTATLKAALDALNEGAVGGGGGIEWDRTPPLLSLLCAKLFLFVWQGCLRYACGCFIFCRRSDFETVGGFDTTLFAAEERGLTQSLRKLGRFVILKERVVSSARKMRIYSTAELIQIAIPALFLGRHRLEQRRGLEMLYDAPRELIDDDHAPVKPTTESMG